MQAIRITLRGHLAIETDVYLEAMAACPPEDPAREQGLAARRAMKWNDKQTTFTFESGDEAALKGMQSALDWIASPSGAELSPSTKRAAARHLALFVYVEARKATR